MKRFNMSSDVPPQAVVEFIQDVHQSPKAMFLIMASILPLTVVVSSAFIKLSLMSSIAWSGLLLILIIIGLMFFTVSKESILVMRKIGLQLRTRYASGREQTKFIPRKDIEDIIINEAITMHKVVYYLAVLLKAGGSPPRLIPLFQHSLPSLNTLKEIQQGCQDVLWDDNR